MKKTQIRNEQHQKNSSEKRSYSSLNDSKYKGPLQMQTKEFLISSSSAYQSIPKLVDGGLKKISNVTPIGTPLAVKKNETGKLSS